MIDETKKTPVYPIKKITAINAMYHLDLLINIASDLDGTFLAWDIDSKELLNINGWLFDIS